VRRPVSNLLGLAVLSYLTERPMHAYELNRLLVERDAARTFKLSYGALYGVVGRLAEAGFIRVRSTGQRGNLPKHVVYELTHAGRAEMRTWLAELLREPRLEHPTFVAALSLVVVLPPDEVASLLQTRLERVSALVDEIRTVRDGAVDGGVHPVFLVEDDLRIALLQTEADFITDLLTKIDGDWAGPWAAFHNGPASEGDRP
jgi:DNA-binding PadR family transcriptional regulator